MRLGSVVVGVHHDASSPILGRRCPNRRTIAARDAPSASHLDKQGQGL